MRKISAGVLLTAAIISLGALASPTSADARSRHRERVARAEIRGDVAEIRRNRTELRNDIREYNRDRGALQRAYRRGRSPAEIERLRNEVRQGRREIFQDRREIRGDYAELRGDLDAPHAHDRALQEDVFASRQVRMEPRRDLDERADATAQSAGAAGRA